MRLALIVATFAIWAGALALGQTQKGAASQSPEPNEPPAAALPGRQVFEKNCSFCHGPDAEGASGPNLTISPVLKQDVNGDLIGNIVRNGRPGKGMPAFQLSEQELAGIAAFLHYQASQAAQANAVARQKILAAGNAEAGKNYFFGAGHCSQCHSPTGDLKGIGSKYSPNVLEAQLIYPQNVPAVATVITSSGQRISGELVHLGEFTVLLRDQTGWVRSWDRRAVKVEVHNPLTAHRELLDRLTNDDIHNLFAYLATPK